MKLSQSLSLKQEMTLSMQQHRQFANILEMTNEELFQHLKLHEGTGHSYPQITIDTVMTVPRRLDVWVHGGMIHEASGNYIHYPDLNGTGPGSGRRMFGLLRWMLQMREKLLKVASGFVLRQHHDFFWGSGRLHPICMRKAVDYINGHLDEFFLDQEIGYTSFTRVLKNKRISVEGKEYELRFFFTTCKVHPREFESWIKGLIDSESRTRPYSDDAIKRLLFEKRGIGIARRTIMKYRQTLKIPSSAARLAAYRRGA